ncbi:ankyrin repeat-containing domain protein [Trichoderma sp. SZMC 28011]
MHMLSQLFYHQSNCLPESEIWSQLQHLSNIHEDLAKNFNALLESINSLDILNVYQEHEDSDTYNLVIPPFAATLNIIGETSIGLHKPHEHLAQFHTPNTKKLLLDKISDAKIRCQTKYHECIHLLSRHGLNVPIQQRVTPIYKNLCDWILSDDVLASWLSNNSVSALASQESDLKSPVKSEMSAASRALITLSLHKVIHETSILTSSLIASIEAKERGKYAFVTLAHRQPQILPLTETQLMASLCCQILLSNPNLFDQIWPLFRTLQKAIRGHNTVWKNIILWKVLKILLSEKTTRETLIIIHQPSDPSFSASFLSLAANINNLIHATEIHCKILIIQTLPVHIHQRNLFVYKEINYNDQELKFALEKDFHQDLVRLLHGKSSIIELPAATATLLVESEVDLYAARLCSKMVDQYGSFSLNLIKKDLATKSYDDWARLILDMIPKTFLSWVRVGLLWISHAMRPLTCREVEELLKFITGSNENPNVMDLIQLLHGLVEIEGNDISVTNLELCQHLLCLMDKRETSEKYKEKGNHNQDDSNNDIVQQTSNQEEQLDAHLEVAQTCLCYITSRVLSNSNSGISNFRTPNPFYVSLSRDVVRAPEYLMESLLPYAVEHWLSHMKLSKRGSTSLQAEIADFLANTNSFNRWMELRVSLWVLNQQNLEQNSIPSPDTLAAKLGLQLSCTSDIIQIIDLAFHSRILENSCTSEKDRGAEDWLSVALAAAQTANIDVLHALDVGELLNETILKEIFETGSEESLCTLLQSRGSWIRQNIHKIVFDSIMIGNFDLIRRLQTEMGDSIDYTNFVTPLIHHVLEDASPVLFNQLWEKLKPQVNLMSKGRTVLHTAACSGQVDLMPQLLSSISEPQLKVNEQDSNALSPLHLATKNGHYAVVEQLLSNGADVDICNKEEQTALHIASARGFVDTVQLLLKHNATLGLEDKERMTPLHYALENSHREVQLLLLGRILSSPLEHINRKTMGIDKRGKDGSTLLLLAVKYNHLEAVKYLLKLQVDVNAALTYSEQTPLHYAAKFNFYDILAELLATKSIDIDATDNDGYTPLQIATNRNNSGIIKKLLEYGANTQTGFLHRTPLAMACMQGHAAAAKLLLPYYSLTNLDSSYYQHASYTNSVDTLTLILNTGVDINTSFGGVGTSLHLASFNGNPRVVNLLLTRRADPEQSDRWGRTPLMDAIRRNATDCVKLLVHAGAKVNIEDHGGDSPLFCAASKGNQECVRIILEAKAEVKVPSSKSSIFSSMVDLSLLEFEFDVFKTILDYILTSRSQEPPKLTPSPQVLRTYLEAGNCDANKIHYLLEKAHSWNPDQDIGDYGTMLQNAAYWGKPGLVKVLIDSDRMDVNKCSKKWGTPLEIAISRKETEGSIEIVDLLIKKGAKVNIGSNFFGSPLHAAASMSRRSMDFIKPENDTDKRYCEMVKVILDSDPSTVNIKAGYYGSPLNAALVGGALSIIDTIMGYSPDLSIRSGSYETALHAAARNGDVEVIKRIMNQGSSTLSPATVDAGGRLPIHIAAISDHDHLIDILTKSSTDESDRPVLTTPDSQGRHSLHFAAGNGSSNFARKMLSINPGAISDADSDGWTPLHWACRHNSVDMVKLLLALEPDRCVKTNLDWRPVDVATYHGFTTISNLVKPKVFDGQRQEQESTSTINELTKEQERFSLKRGEITRSESNSHYSCDDCHCDIYGLRHCCNCHGYDLCFKCFRQGNNTLFKGHQFESWTPEGEKITALQQ